MSTTAVEHTKTAWLGEFPAHWAVLRIKNVATINDEALSETTNPDFLIKYIDIGNVNSNGEINEIQEFKFSDAPSRARRILKKDDVIISTVRTYLKAITQISFDVENHVASTGFAVLRPKDNVTSNFLTYAVKAKYFIDSIMANSFGVSYPAINSSTLAALPIIVPPKDEQDEIVQYIKAQEEKINLFIQKKQRFIELLKEQRQRIINYSVTKGINPNAELKDTGIEWLGEIPKHWQLLRLKNVAEVVLGKMLCNEDKGGYALKPYLKSKNIGWDKVIVEEVDEMWFSPKEMLTYRVKENDLLVSEGGEVGKTCIWKNELEECYIQNSVHKLTCFEDCLPEFYLFWMGMLGSVGYFRSIVNQVSIAHLTREKVVTVICLHPPIEEQKEIVSHIKTETATIDTAIAKAEREIELIREYKEAMIAEAVMGKRK